MEKTCDAEGVGYYFYKHKAKEAGLILDAKYQGENIRYDILLNETKLTLCFNASPMEAFGFINGFAKAKELYQKEEK